MKFWILVRGRLSSKISSPPLSMVRTGMGAVLAIISFNDFEKIGIDPLMVTTKL